MGGWLLAWTAKIAELGGTFGRPHGKGGGRSCGGARINRLLRDAEGVVFLRKIIVNVSAVESGNGRAKNQDFRDLAFHPHSQIVPRADAQSGAGIGNGGRGHIAHADGGAVQEMTDG